MTTSDIVRCPLHPDVEPHVYGDPSAGWVVECADGFCWSGPECKTAAEAIARWNEVVGAVVEREAFRLAMGDALKVARAAEAMRDKVAEASMEAGNALRAQLADERKHADALACELEGIADSDSRDATTLSNAAFDALEAHRERRAAGEKEGA